MGKNTSISLSPFYEEFIKEQVNSGKYGSTSEVLREGLRLMVAKEEEAQYIRKAIQEGIDSGVSVDFDGDKLLKNIHKKNLDK